MELGAGMVIETVDAIINGTVKTIPQDELLNGAEPTPAPKIFKDTCLIDWNRPATAIYNHIRGLSPYPAAWTQFNKEDKDYQIKIYETSLPMDNSLNLQPGQIMVQNRKAFVGCSDGMLELKSIQLSGKKRMNVSDFLLGFDLNNICLA